MMRIYCQYSIAGFKIFNLTSFVNKQGDDRFIRMPEIEEAKASDNQDLLVTGKCHCGLDMRIMRFFSKNTASLLILGGCGENKDETSLLLRDEEHRLTYAFVSNDKEDIKMFAQMASLWITERKDEIIEKLMVMSEKAIINDEITFAFHEDKWRELRAEVEKTPINLKLRSVATGDKNLLVNLKINKSEILKDAKITTPLSCFVTIPGSEVVQAAERNGKLIWYGIGILSALAIGGIIYYSLTSK